MGLSKPYPLENPIARGYAVRLPDSDPVDNQWNGRFLDLRGDKIHFWIEDIEANFAMAGSTAQSRHVRQFFPHNMVQPSIIVRGIAPNSYQYNRLANFVRQAQWDAVSGQELARAGIDLRGEPDNPITTLNLTIRAGITGLYPPTGRTVKGRHKAWKLEGYVKSMSAGAKRFEQAPRFQFEFLIAASKLADGSNVGIWSDTAVQGDILKSWMDIFKSRGAEGFVQPTGTKNPDLNNEPEGGPYSGASPGLG